ncbi:polysaccharide biosynthesis protein GumN, partial [Salmonella enterica subsp. enterica serovar Enteritidis]|nr:polysaccharide biosynthesis protein GumN [Salmonella enterica subsp. enterica serovar Enteritidis]
MKNWHQKMLSLVLAAGLLATASPAMAATSTQPLTVKVNDQKIQYSKGIAPTVQQKVTLVPLRSTLQAMNIQLSKVSKDSITVVANGKSVTVNSKLFKINGTAY